MFPGVERSWGESEGWTARLVEVWLIAAFRALPNHPTFSGPPTFTPSDALSPGHREVLGWASRFVSDRRDRDMLMGWARCQATGASFGELSRGLHWPRSSAEDGRRRAAAAIAEALGSRNKHLDSRKGTPGRSLNNEAEPLVKS